MSAAYAPWAIAGMLGVQQAQAAPSVDLSKQRIIIGTPTRGREVGDNYRLCVDALREHLRDQVLPLGTIPAMRDGEQMMLMGAELARDARLAATGALCQPHDLARTRSRMIRLFLETSAAEWLLFWDDDVWCREPHVALQNMLTVALAADVHVVGAFYPAKRYDEEAIVAAVRRGEAHPLRHGFTIGDMRFWRRADYAPAPPHKWLLPVSGIGFGFCLISRIAAIALTERFRGELSFPDHHLGGKTVDLCDQINDSFDSYSEDYSFCIRAAAGGFPVCAYMGPGSPMIHDGTTSFEAAPETLLTTKTGRGP